MFKHTFGKSDRLKSKQQIEQLFVDGNCFTEFPLKVVWRLSYAKESSIQIAFSVPKKKLPKAAHRNHMKRYPFSLLWDNISVERRLPTDPIGYGVPWKDEYHTWLWLCLWLPWLPFKLPLIQIYPF